ncbi:MAG: hypothetical protein OXH86_08095 [Acidimicrobiaceae bacterium]|nr:hypothetical protein [Acidimicrobiaceae bacterium]MDE0497299.1 hypothetical protein [Acidimicrobiaceae bacterium]
MSNDVLVDDHILLKLLLGEEPRELRPRGGIVATTGLWYHRLCRALADQAVVGSMSRRLGDVSPAAAADVVAAVIELPMSIELVSLRTLGWPMGELIRDGARLNLLSLEALAAARFLDAEICCAQANENEPLMEAARKHAISVRNIQI